ncbi:MAG: hypothetical protein JRG96_06220 [Deltaproteobacteria bacterium]|nr:hypothetical protein [Deltaproteobacteria bacterium]MBW2417272.1 hypothetical protein [Deltaproteobacteria bacterium]
MGALPTVESGAAVRARRWDAVVLGSGVHALVAAARLGMAGHRVLVVEEEASQRAYPGLREPFFLAGAREGGVLEQTLRTLTIPLIDRRRIVDEDVAYQLVGRDLRADVGLPDLTAYELVAWGLAKPEEAQALLRALAEAGEVERKAMLDAPLVRVGRLAGLGRTAVEGSHLRGLPAEARSADPRLALMLRAQARALGNLPLTVPGPECQARLLSTALAGGASFRDGAPWLHGILRKRVESVYGEFRALSGEFRLVSAAGLPAVSVTKTGELWIGRILVVAAPGSAVAAAHGPGDPPDFLAAERSHGRRAVVHLRARRHVLPPAMASRLILVDEEQSSGELPSVTSLAVFEQPEEREWVNLVLRSVVLEEGDEAAEKQQAEERMEQRMIEQVRELLPFAEDALERRPVQRPLWDDEDCLEEPPAAGHWPGHFDLRVHGRPPVYALDRSRVAGLGLEGELLLGWRGGDALAAELG